MISKAVQQLSMAEAMAVHDLSAGWSFKQTDSEEWLPVARVPTNVHLDLMDNKKCVLKRRPERESS